MGLVRNDAYVEDKARNPFNFQLFNLKSMKLLGNGEEYPTPGIELEDNGHVNGYNSLFLGSGTMHRDQGLQGLRLVHVGSKDQMDTLSELALNLLSGVIPSETNHYNKLKRHAQTLRALAEKKIGESNSWCDSNVVDFYL